MDATVKAYLGQVVRDCLTILGEYQGPMDNPTIDGNYSYTATMRSRMNEFFKDDIASNINAEIGFLEDSYAATGATPDSIESGSYILSVESADGLKGMLGEVEAPTGTTPEKTVFVLPDASLLAIIDPPKFSRLQFSIGEPILDDRWQSAYLATVATHVEQVLAGNNIPLDSINLNLEKLDYEMKLAMKSVLAETAMRGFRKPNSLTTTRMRRVAQEYFGKVEAVCSQFVSMVTDFIGKAQGLGITVESIKIDFASHLNDLALRIAAFELKQYEDKLNYALKQYQARVDEAAAKLNQSRLDILKSSFTVKDLLYQLNQSQAAAKLTSDRAENLTKFADVYKMNNKAALTEQQQAAAINITEAESKAYKETADLEATQKGLTARLALVGSNKAVIAEKLAILDSDLKAYNQLADISKADLSEAKAEWLQLQSEYKNKIIAFNALPGVLDGTQKVLRSLLDAEITITKLAKTG